MSGESSNEVISARVGNDIDERLTDFEDEFEITRNRAIERALDNGLESLGYAEDHSAEQQTAIGRAAGAAAMPLAVAGFMLAIGADLPANVSMYAASVSLAVAIVALFVERVEPLLSTKLGVPKPKQHPDVVPDGGEE